MANKKKDDRVMREGVTNNYMESEWRVIPEDQAQQRVAIDGCLSLERNVARASGKRSCREDWLAGAWIRSRGGGEDRVARWRRRKRWARVGAGDGRAREMVYAAKREATSYNPEPRSKTAEQTRAIDDSECDRTALFQSSLVGCLVRGDALGLSISRRHHPPFSSLVDGETRESSDKRHMERLRT
jgi:hypothetical protein